MTISESDMINTVLAALRCPTCHSTLRARPHALDCGNGHSFDIARQGYAHLGTGRRLPAGDTAQMVADRIAFLDAGHYQPLREAIAHATPHDAELIVDVGAGPGYYLAGVLEQAGGASGLAMDVSKPALKKAAHCHERAEAVLADAWRELPLRDDSVDVLLNVFAPRNGDEFARVLKKTGVLVVVTPQPDHLKELRERYALLDVDPDKGDRLGRNLQRFSRISRAELAWPLKLSAPETRTLIGMGPNAFHGDNPADAMQTSAAIYIDVYVDRSISSQPAGAS
jgi:23S rRNA (guanine745-N1)-methyltransferase